MSGYNTGVHLYNELLRSSKKEETLTFWNSMDRPRDYYTKWNKPVNERQIPYYFTCKWDLMNKITNEQNRIRGMKHGTEWQLKKKKNRMIVFQYTTSLQQQQQKPQHSKITKTWYFICNAWDMFNILVINELLRNQLQRH